MKIISITVTKEHADNSDFFNIKDEFIALCSPRSKPIYDINLEIEFSEIETSGMEVVVKQLEANADILNLNYSVDFPYIMGVEFKSLNTMRVSFQSYTPFIKSIEFLQNQKQITQCQKNPNQ